MSFNRTTQQTRRRWTIHLALLIALVISLLPGVVGLQTPTAQAAIPATLPFVYFVPFPEDQVKQSFDEIATNSSTYVSVVYITVAEANTVIVYDHLRTVTRPTSLNRYRPRRASSATATPPTAMPTPTA